jgi:hypothetical protein
MTRNLVLLAAVSILLGGCIYVEESGKVCDEQREMTYAPTAKKAPAQLLRHVVLFKFNESATAADIRKIENAFSALPSRIDAIYGFEWGTDVSVEDRQKGFTHCFVVTFRSEADRAKYLPHPAHKEFGELVGPYLDDVMVVDYWAK